METGGTTRRCRYGHICIGAAICNSAVGKPDWATRRSLCLESRGGRVARHFPFDERDVEPQTPNPPMMFSAMLTDAFREANPGLDIRYRTDGRLFNLRRLQAKTKIHVDKLRDFLFADDCALNAGSAEDMHYSMDLFSNACSNFGLTISTKKTEVMYQPAPKNLYQEPIVV